MRERREAAAKAFIVGNGGNFLVFSQADGQQACALDIPQNGDNRGLSPAVASREISRQIGIGLNIGAVALVERLTERKQNESSKTIIVTPLFVCVAIEPVPSISHEAGLGSWLPAPDLVKADDIPLADREVIRRNFMDDDRREELEGFLGIEINLGLPIDQPAKVPSQVVLPQD